LAKGYRQKRRGVVKKGTEAPVPAGEDGDVLYEFKKKRGVLAIRPKTKKRHRGASKVYPGKKTT